MKALMIVFAMTLGLTAQAERHAGYDVEVSQHGGSLHINYKTHFENSSMCHLKAYDLRISLPGGPLVPGRTVPAKGRVELIVSRDLNGMCMMAFGPHSGGLSLPVGSDLPQLPAGKYELVINGGRYQDFEVIDELD